MPNPWLKKNPLMSMWLSGANRLAATMRGQATAQVKRRMSAAVTKATSDKLKSLVDASTPASPKAKPRRRR